MIVDSALQEIGLTFPAPKTTDGSFRGSVYDTDVRAHVHGQVNVLEASGRRLYLADLARHGAEEVRARMCSPDQRLLLTHWGPGVNTPGLEIRFDRGAEEIVVDAKTEPGEDRAQVALPQIVYGEAQFPPDETFAKSPSGTSTRCPRRGSSSASSATSSSGRHSTRAASTSGPRPALVGSAPIEAVGVRLTNHTAEAVLIPARSPAAVLVCKPAFMPPRE